MSLFIADNLHLWRGDQHVLRGLSVTLDAGRCLQVMGANGAGKTTLLRVLCGLLPLEQGTLMWRDAKLGRDRYAFNSELAWLGHGNGLKADLSARENLRYSAGLRRRLTPGAIDAALASVGFPQSDDRLVWQMSAGQQRRVALARVLLLQCPLWMLDEPTANLDARGQQLFVQLLDAHLQQGGAAVVATHQGLGLASARLQTLELS
jgi:heme exporter protein A